MCSLCLVRPYLHAVTWLPVTTLTAIKVHEDDIFERQDMLHFYLRKIKTLPIYKIPKHELGTLMVDFWKLWEWTLGKTTKKIEAIYRLVIVQIQKGFVFLEELKLLSRTLNIIKETGHTEII